MKNLISSIPYMHGKFETFTSIKELLLDKIENSKTPDNDTSISYLDWEKSDDLNRPWVKFILPLLSYNLTKLLKNHYPGYLILDRVWYQQYTNNSHHDGHTHSHHFTGVFYLEFPNDSPKTQLYYNDSIISIDAQEGDLIIFPSYIIHRSSYNKSQHTKSIISFNMDFFPDLDYISLIE